MKTRQDIELMIQQLEEDQPRPNKSDSQSERTDMIEEIIEMEAQISILRWVLDNK